MLLAPGYEMMYGYMYMQQFNELLMFSGPDTAEWKGKI